MNVSFVGSPCSGKTTIAAMVFAKLKGHGFSVEFVPEYARLYIARERLDRELPPEAQLQLQDDDQYEIMSQQADAESTFSRVCGPSVIVVADTSPLNSLLYMSQEYRQHRKVQNLLKEKVVPYLDLVFYCPPVDEVLTLDPNRIHSRKQGLEIDAQIPSIIREAAPNLEMLTLNGIAELRAATVLSHIHSRYSR